jgi:transcriptional regulator with XRE-family HTH domain
MGAPNTPANRPSIEKAAWVAEAVRLVCEGMSERQIATRLGLHHSTVNEALHKEFERVRPNETEVQAAREKKRERLYRGLEKWMRVRDDSIAACEADPKRAPDYKAGELVVKHEVLIAAVEGTDAPKQAELTGKDGAPLNGEPSPEAASGLVRQAFGSHAMKDPDDEVGDAGPGDNVSLPESPTES